MVPETVASLLALFLSYGVNFGVRDEIPAPSPATQEEPVVSASDRPGEIPDLSLADTELLVIDDAAKRLDIPLDSIRVVESTERTWPDEQLGCTARRTAEPKPVPGYLIVLDAAGTRQTYHSDRRGHISRCVIPDKELSPILR
jgi:hypothetical protein